MQGSGVATMLSDPGLTLSCRVDHGPQPCGPRAKGAQKQSINGGLLFPNSLSVGRCTACLKTND